MLNSAEHKSAALSALIIAKNEEADLPGCLESLRDAADEIVVFIDAASSDGTEKIARDAGCKVTIRPFVDYASFRQAALESCTKEWVLWIDCDERAPSDLGGGQLGGGNAAAFSLPFVIRFLGRTLRWGGLGSEEHVRLFKREKAKFVGGALHEALEVDGPISFLNMPIQHEPYKDISEYLQKLDRYTTLAAQKKRQAGKSFHFWHHAILPWELFRRVILLGAFMDGFPGLTWAVLSSFHHWLKYVKLKEMENA